jgi:hypothetical protein
VLKFTHQRRKWESPIPSFGNLFSTHINNINVNFINGDSKMGTICLYVNPDRNAILEKIRDSLYPNLTVDVATKSFFMHRVDGFETEKEHYSKKIERE